MVVGSLGAGRRFDDHRSAILCRTGGDDAPGRRPICFSARGLRKTIWLSVRLVAVPRDSDRNDCSRGSRICELRGCLAATDFGRQLLDPSAGDWRLRNQPLDPAACCRIDDRAADLHEHPRSENWKDNSEHIYVYQDRRAGWSYRDRINARLESRTAKWSLSVHFILVESNAEWMARRHGTSWMRSRWWRGACSGTLDAFG